MKTYNKPELVLFAGAEENIALTLDSKTLSVGNDSATHIAPKADDVW